ncbi:MAG: pyridoxamine 5'-phosphate oxidase family protein [Gammaproteobacteria bacterium]|nr:pyridoxamine 5'-phosphate oxidase family protein [Gammaproteobacteria bacterium]
MSLTMSVTERQQFLAGVHVAIISIPRSAKGPLTVPIWYDYEPGGEPWMITNRDSIKGKLLTRSQRISLCVQSETAPYKYVSIEGSFAVTPLIDGQLLAMAIRYLGEEQGRSYAESFASAEGSSNNEDSIVVSIKPETWYTVDYSKG